MLLAFLQRPHAWVVPALGVCSCFSSWSASGQDVTGPLSRRQR